MFFEFVLLLGASKTLGCIHDKYIRRFHFVRLITCALCYLERLTLYRTICYLCTDKFAKYSRW